MVMIENLDDLTSTELLKEAFEKLKAESNIMDIEYFDHLQSLVNVRHLLSVDEENLIRDLGNKFKHLK